MRMKRVFALSTRFSLLFVLFTVHTLRAQIPTLTLKGTVKSIAGRSVALAKISAKNLNTGAVEEVQAGPDGSFQISLAAGAYEISLTAEGYGTKTVNVALPQTTEESLVIELVPSPAGGLPNAPSASQTAPSLSDLGFPVEQTQGDAKRQALLDKRTHMLKIHQKLGLITTAPLLATLVASAGAGGKSTSSTDRTVHMVLGAVTSDLYFTSAYFAIRAPRVPGAPTRGPIRLHKALAWVHGPGMILTPILGALAYEQKNKGEKVQGIASAHGPVAIVTAGAFGAALLAVSVKF
jgi:hypothetical protein